MLPQRRQLASHRPSPYPVSNIQRGPKYSTQRLEGIITSIYAEMSKMQYQQYEAIVMLRNCDDMLRKQETDKAELEEQNRWLVEHIKIAHQEDCDVELKNRELEYCTSWRRKAKSARSTPLKSRVERLLYMPQLLSFSIYVSIVL
ncbi:unnamed protein product [Penicillium salamii]|uniref:Uncharacterized protein n=1 Tax=Penicillium salamii TaxID=1612424 RepID=A0A9W4I528_9EURO|nr:unnamed protein product [Penicillium salamii]CAG8223332.1 unnamed protein product [Penicillium salamii]CAG8316360.1 unnamed protein product [Penicillium salamii]CAG8430973.1 unnamed protein product [Penicillium salamii]CAG8557057.1 unnamed protein product [Penicillium salamii]